MADMWVLFFGLVLCVFAAPKIAGDFPKIQDRIAGGNFARISDHPYQLSLRRNEVHTCGAVLIGEWWALTAAHCVSKYPVKEFTIRAKSTELDEGDVILISGYFVHNSYDFVTLDYDVALLLLSGPLNIDDSLAPVALPSPGSVVEDGTVGVASGWGRVEFGDASFAKNLRAVALPILNRTTCQEYYGESRITQTMFCAGEKYKAICQGDAGGPFVVDGVLVGLGSWGGGCYEPDFPDVFTDVSTIRDWIKERTGI